MTDVELDFHIHGQPQRHPRVAPIRAVTDDLGGQWAVTIHGGAVHVLAPSWLTPGGQP